MSAACAPRGCGRSERRCPKPCAWSYSHYYLLLDGMVCSSLAGTPPDRSMCPSVRFGPEGKSGAESALKVTSNQSLRVHYRSFRKAHKSLLVNLLAVYPS